MKSNTRILIIGILAIVLTAGAAVGMYANSRLSKVERVEIDEEELQISEELDEELKDEYLNVAVFGVDIKDGESDAVYVASLNRTTKEVRLLPVYGNTLMAHGSETLRMKDAYADGGAEEAIAVLNENLELNIKDYVSVNFEAMVDMIDILGGIELDITEEEIPHVNGYAQDIAGWLGKEEKEIRSAGPQLLDGIQATGYCRIRVTDGGDVKRGSRQQEVINKMMEKLKDAGFSQLDQIIDVVFPQVETSFDKSEMISYGKDAAAYSLTILPAFPRGIKEQVRKPEEEGVQFTDYEEIVEGISFEKDVADVHDELF